MTRAVVVHGAAQAVAAARVAASASHDLTLISGPGGVRSVGPGWFAAVIEAARAAAPEIRIDGVLRCDDAPGLALGALRSGIAKVALDANQSAFERVAAIANSLQCEVVIVDDWELLDLANVSDAEVSETVGDWLEASDG